MARIPKRLRLPGGKLESAKAFETRTGFTVTGQRIKQNVTVTNSDPNLTQVTGRAKAKKEVSTAVRNQIIRYLSDYISEEIPGFGKKTSRSQAFRDYTGLTGDVSPDAEVDIKAFEKLTGIKISQTNVLKENAENVGFFETKVGGLGTGSTQVSFTALELAGRNDPTSFRVVQSKLDQLGRTNLQGRQAYDFIFTNNMLRGKGEQIKKTIQAKFENLLIVNAYDDDKKGGRSLQFNFIESPLKGVNLNNPAEFAKYIDLRIRPRTESSSAMKKAGRTQRRVISYRVEAKPTKELMKRWEYKDVTKRIASAHKGAFSSAIRIYIERRIKQYAASGSVSKEKVTDLLAFTVALAEEFKAGGFTPLSLSTKIRPPKNLGLKEGKAAVLADIPDEPKSMQRFISGVQLTELVQRRLGKTMRKFGDPQAPDLVERSGRFRESVNIVANYRKNVIMYTYNPVYDNLNRYGYRPSEQVGKATREVVQGLFARAFNIVKG